jgi:hypothetical protein
MTALYEAAKKEGGITVYSPAELLLRGLEKELPRTFAGIEVRSATVEPTELALCIKQRDGTGVGAGSPHGGHAPGSGWSRAAVCRDALGDMICGEWYTPPICKRAV